MVLLPTNTAGRRRRQSGGLSLLKRMGLVLYAILVLISALIVGTYLIFNLVVRPPEIAEEPTPAPPDASAPATEDPLPDASTPQEPLEAPLERKDGVYNFLLLGSDKASGSTDTIIVVSFDTVEHTIGMVSIPRDTAIDRTWSKYPKINSAYGKGIDVLKEEIKRTFGIPIDFYVKINLNAFIALVDQLGGVDVYIPIDMSYDDPYQDLHIHYNKGHHHLNGQQAMEVVRFRHNNEEDGGGGYNDEGRAEMQRTVLVALAKKVLSWNSLTKVQAFVDIFQTYVKTDLSATDMAYFATEAIQVDLSNDLKQGALEGRSDGIYKGYTWCYVYQADTILPILNELVNPYTTDLTAEHLELPVPSGYTFNY